MNYWEKTLYVVASFTCMVGLAAALQILAKGC